MMPSEVTKYIVSVPNINGGMATIAGTRVTVAEIIDHIETELRVMPRKLKRFKKQLKALDSKKDKDKSK